LENRKNPNFFEKKTGILEEGLRKFYSCRRVPLACPANSKEGDRYAAQFFQSFINKKIPL